MNCYEFASLLDEQGFAVLARPVTDDTRRAIETHAETCDDCQAALSAARALTLDPVPMLGPAELPAGVEAGGVTTATDGGVAACGGGHFAALAWPARAASFSARSGARALLRRPAAALGLLVLGGAVFAAIGVVSRVFDAGSGGDDAASALTADNGEAVGSSAGASATTDAPTDEAAFVAAAPLVGYLDAAERQAHADFSTELLGTMPDGEYFALLRLPPVYPAAAAQRALEGFAVVEFTITAAGDVVDAHAVDSSNPVFEASAIESALKAKYRPRVTDGVPVAVSGVRTMFRFELEDRDVADEPERRDVDENGDVGRIVTDRRPSDLPLASGAATRAAPPVLDWSAFGGLLGRLTDCVERNDLRCAELELDVLLARADLAPGQQAYLHHIYGFIYHRRGRYELAIESYRKAVGEGSSGGYMRPQQLKTLAQIYYERDRYQDALEAMLEYVRVAPGVRATDYLFMDRLRQLGARDG